MSAQNTPGPRRWHKQRRLFDGTIASLGVEFGQNRFARPAAVVSEPAR